MRPSDITDGILAGTAPSTAEWTIAASMRPSDITDGIAGLSHDSRLRVCA